MWLGRIGSLFAALACFAISSAWGAAIPHCAGLVEARNVLIARVEKNGDLVLTDGRTVRLEGLLLPAGPKDHAPAYWAGQAVAALDTLARGRRAVLSLAAPKEDRYGRLRAQVFFSNAGNDNWLQIAMLRRGFARVSIAPDRHECASELYAVEAEAREKHAGIWASGFYTVRMPDELDDVVGTFQIIQGKAVSAAIKSGRGYIDFGPDWREDFKVTISPDDMKRFREAGVDPRNYAGLTLRVRGFVERMDGPAIEVASPEGIEVVQKP